MGRRWICSELIEDYLKGAIGRFKNNNVKNHTNEDTVFYKIPKPGGFYKTDTVDYLDATGGEKRR